MAERAASLTTEAAGIRIRAVPIIGFVEFEKGGDLDRATALERASSATLKAASIQDLQPHRWLPPDSGNKKPTDHHPIREVVQVLVTWSSG